jgi:uncharacterized membrane protein
MPEQKKSIIKRIAGYFLRGVAVLLPVSLTFYLIVGSIDWVDRVIFNVFPPLEFPGLGFIIVVAFITIIGILFSGFIGKTVLGWLDELMTRTPLVKIIYSSLKDLIDAFVGEKKKFNEPVLVTIDTIGTQLMAFITRKDLSQLGIIDKVAVYCPYSYALSGRLLIVNKSQITPFDGNATEAMKFIVSGGVTGFIE